MAIFWGNWFNAISAAVNVITKPMMTSGSQPGSSGGIFDQFGAFNSRRARYDVFWSYYENTTYDNVHLWAPQLKVLYALFKHTRGCYNPLFRLGEFWATHVFGGALDATQENGRVRDSAIPILTEDPKIREAIGKLWADSEWQINKDVMCRLGAVLGDVPVKLYDDPKSGKVRIRAIHPGSLRWIKMNSDGNVEGYVLQEYRWDPTYNPQQIVPQAPAPFERTVLYTEEAILEDGRVKYRTLLNGNPFSWNGASAEWYEPWPFIPFILHPHFKVVPDYYWGWSEYQAALTKAREVDDVGSKLHDQIRKAQDPRFFVAGVQPSRTPLKLKGNDPQTSDTQPERQELPFFYGGLGATAVPLVFPLDVQFTSVEVQNQLAALEKDFPELRYDSARVSGDASAKALREVRKSAEAKVHNRRAGYDASLEKIMKMALAIGGEAGYPGYEGFSAQRYLDGEFKFQIGNRSVFLKDPLDTIEEETAFWSGAQIAVKAGAPLRIYLERNGWSEAEIKHFEDTREEEDARAVAMQPDTTSTPAEADPNDTSVPDEQPSGTPSIK